MTNETTILLRGREITIPGLALADSARLWPELCELDQGINFSNLDKRLPAAIAVIHAAVQRVDSSITLDELEAELSIRDLRRVLMAIAAKSTLPQIAQS
jgi:hypothetical protein